MPTVSEFDIRFVSHPLFFHPEALVEIERLRPADCEEDWKVPPNRGAASSTPIGKLCEQPVLSRGLERYLFLRMNYEKFAALKHRVAEQESHLAEAARIRNRILTANLRLLASIAGRFATPTMKAEDWISEGVLPLMRAIELFDISRGWAFGTYATHVLRNHFRRMGKNRLRKNQLAGSFSGEQITELAEAGIPASRQEELADRQQRLVKRCLAELSATDQIILRTRFGFDDPASPKLRSYAEVGRALGLSKERVRVRAHQALEQLRKTAQARRWEFPELEYFQLHVSFEGFTRM